MNDPLHARPIAYSYERCSRGAQAKGDTFRRQHDPALAFCEEHGLLLDDRLDLRDKGRSAFRGTHRKKGALGRFLAEVRRGAIPRGRWFLIENLDRLSREPVLDALDVFRDLLRSGITIATLDMKWVLTEARLNNPAQTWMLNAIVSMMARAHEESFQKSRRLKETKSEKRKRIVEAGAVESHACPAWLSFDKGRGCYVLNQHAPAIARLFELAAQHVSQYRIALELPREGYMPPKGGTHWQTSYISKVLRNDASIGIYRPSIMVDGIERKTGDVVPDYYPAVTTAEIFKRANEAKRTRHASTGAKGKTFANLFSRICFCGACGSPMVINSVDKLKRRSKITYLICSNKRAQRGCTAKPNLRYDILQKTVLRNVRELDVSKLMPDDLADARIIQLDTETARAERHVADLSEVVENLLDKIERVKGGSKRSLSSMCTSIRAARPRSERSSSNNREGVGVSLNSKVKPMQSPDPTLSPSSQSRCGAKTRNSSPCGTWRVTGKSRCRMHGGAPGSGAPKGSRNGRYKHGGFTCEAIEERRALREMVAEFRDMAKALW